MTLLPSTNAHHPLLYSFRRCPYAMRARIALLVARQTVQLREIVLRDKPQAFLDASPSASVPCLVLDDGIIDESLDIMVWALKAHDPQGWLTMPQAGWDWIARNDGPFKQALDRTKYSPRYPGTDPVEHRALAAQFLADLDRQIDTWIFAGPSLADYAIAPFVRQFAFIDTIWFDGQPWPRLQAWLDRFLASDVLAASMGKYPLWQPGDAPVLFP